MFLVFWPQGVWHLSSLTRTGIEAISAALEGDVNHWPTREVPGTVGF